MDPSAARFRLPVLLLALALCTMAVTQTVSLVTDRENLAAVRASQEATVQESLKLRQQLAALAGKTAQLAEQGDAAARAIVEDMRKQGIALNPPNASAR